MPLTVGLCLVCLQLVELQKLMADGDPRAIKVYEALGIEFGYTLAHFAEFYDYSSPPFVRSNFSFRSRTIGAIREIDADSALANLTNKRRSHSPGLGGNGSAASQGPSQGAGRAQPNRR